MGPVSNVLERVIGWGARCGAAVLFAAAATLAAQVARPVVAAPTSCTLENIERIVAVGDVHGAYDRYIEILRTAGVIDTRQRWSGGRTHLVQLGDIVDRGPDSRKALDLLRRLEPDAESAGGAVHVLLGNHEVARMLGDLRYVDPGEYRAFVTSDSEEIRQRVAQSPNVSDRDAFLKATPPGSIEMQIAFGPDGTYGKWLRTLDAVAKINGVLFLHGGISPAVSSVPCDEINATVRREVAADLDQTRRAPLASLAAREDGPLWYRGLAEQPDSFAPEVEGILTGQHARAIVVAHTVSTTGRIRVRFGGSVIQIDTGMQPAYVQNGRASALEIRGNQFTAIYTDRRDMLEIPAK
jgi:calcineurin-like phosphoesterase family protein